MTIQPYDMNAAVSQYDHVRVEHDQTVPPETVTESKDKSQTEQGGDRLFISPAAQIYARFARHVSTVLEEFVEQS